MEAGGKREGIQTIKTGGIWLLGVAWGSGLEVQGLSKARTVEVLDDEKECRMHFPLPRTSKGTTCRIVCVRVCLLRANICWLRKHEIAGKRVLHVCSAWHNARRHSSRPYLPGGPKLDHAEVVPEPSSFMRSRTG